MKPGSASRHFEEKYLTDNLIFFFMSRNMERAQCALSRVRTPLEKERKGNEKNKTN